MEHADVPLIPNQIADKSHVQSVCTIECEPKPNVSDMISAPIFCFKKANFDAIREFLENIDFQSLLDCESVDDMLEIFYAVIYEIFIEHVPQSSIRASNRPPWFDKKLSNLKNVRNRLH